MKSVFLIFISIVTIQVQASKLLQDLRPKQIKFLKKSPINRDQIGFVLIDIETNKTVESYNANTLFLPASLSKIPTTYFALKTLGSDFKFESNIFITGEIEKSILKGDIYFYSNGDPFLTNSKIQNLILELKLKGIKSITGNFYYDESALTKSNRISSLGLGDQTYNTGIGPFNAEFNRFSVWRYGKSRHTSKSQFKTIPSLESLKVKKVIAPFSPGIRFRNDSNNDEKEVWEISHQQRYKRLEEIPIRNTSLFAAMLFRHLAKLQGIELNSPSVKKVPASAKKIATLYSLPLSQLASMAMEYSNNLFTEIFLLTAAKKIKGSNLTLAESANEMKLWMHKEFPNDNWDKSMFENGSGLSIFNQIQPMTLAKFFQRVHDKKIGNSFYWNMLSLSGQSGWMKKRLNDPEMSYRVWAKTGSLDYISNLSGYLMTKNGKRLAFAFFGNDFKKRKLLQAPNSKKLNKLRHRAKKWRVDTMETMDKFLRDWVNHY